MLYANLPSSPSQGTVLRKPCISFPWKSICLAKVPRNVAFLTWTATLEKILTIKKLRLRHILIVDWFCMCKSSGESIDHLFLHCPMVLRYMVLHLLLVWANLGDAEIYGSGVKSVLYFPFLIKFVLIKNKKYNKSNLKQHNNHDTTCI